MLHGYLPNILDGATVTLTVALASLAIAVMLGLAGAAMKLSASRVARSVATVYTTVIRGVPDLVLMLLIFYGGQLAINELAPRLGYAGYVDINPFVADQLHVEKIVRRPVDLHGRDMTVLADIDIAHRLLPGFVSADFYRPRRLTARGNNSAAAKTHAICAPRPLRYCAAFQADRCNEHGHGTERQQA